MERVWYVSVLMETYGMSVCPSRNVWYMSVLMEGMV